jgi:hypothetical protein
VVVVVAENICYYKTEANGKIRYVLQKFMICTHLQQHVPSIAWGMMHINSGSGRIPYVKIHGPQRVKTYQSKQKTQKLGRG